MIEVAWHGCDLAASSRPRLEEEGRRLREMDVELQQI
jgi:hypothetical protein